MNNNSTANIEQKELARENKIDIIPDDSPVEYMDTYEVAKDYLEFAPISRSKLYEILLSEGHEVEAASYVVASVQVDWGKNALKKAHNLLQVQGFSKHEMIDQLSFEGYTEDSIRYAIKKIY